jgi:carbamate kinase
VIATDVPAVAVNYGQPDERFLGRMSAAALRALADAGHFAGGSMGPKVDAACRFVEAGGERAVITSLDQIGGDTGTIVTVNGGE